MIGFEVKYLALWIEVFYLVTYGHVSFTNVVCMAQICPLGPVQQGEPMKAFHSISCSPASKRYIVLRFSSHIFQQILECIHLHFASETVLGFVCWCLDLKYVVHYLECGCYSL